MCREKVRVNSQKLVIVYVGDIIRITIDKCLLYSSYPISKAVSHTRFWGWWWWSAGEQQQEGVTFEEALQVTGSFGLYQKRLVCLICLTNALVMVHNVSPVFTMKIPKHRYCHQLIDAHLYSSLNASPLLLSSFSSHVFVVKNQRNSQSTKTTKK